MDGSLFDPTRMRAKREASSRAPGPDAGDGAWSVSALARAIEHALSASLPASVRVVGEVSNRRERTHVYFDLKDEGAVVSCAMFQSVARKHGAVIADGRCVLLSGRVEWYAAGGRLSLIVTKAEPVGEGALEARLRALVAELRGLGYFDAERKRPLPTFPRNIGVVTSRSGAALQDVLDTIRRRCPAVGVVLADARVQGEGAAAEVARAIRTLGRARTELAIDAVLVTRGGGSIEDLWAFNERVVADAVRDCPVPVVCAIGHETDVTIAELVADERAATPTQAAMRLTPDRVALARQVSSERMRLGQAILRVLRDARHRTIVATRGTALEDPELLTRAARERFDSATRTIAWGVSARTREAHARLARLAARLARVRPEAALARRRARIDAAGGRLARAIAGRVDASGLARLHDRLARSMGVALREGDLRLESLERELDAVGPGRVLARGYSVTLDARGRVVREVGDAPAGSAITTRLARGSVTSVVQGDGRESGTPAREIVPSPPAAARRRLARPDPEQMGLF
ncbi:MAG: exodeoxyribonuclease VII large subunit [Phycisphaerales bacterium]|jgi:exodeoxyribonuclease VII large subunit|nr:exodeoxyribonuclease VII large subunit [Phycisphaerales bacterium]